MVKDKKAIYLIVVCTLFTALAQFFLKMGLSSFRFDISSLISNYYLLAGVFFYIVAIGLLFSSLYFGELSVVFPLVTLGYVWVAIMGYTLLGESIGIFRVVGLSLIIFGAIFLGGST
jgi:uncharacterized membrane protein